ncbi:Major facilitator superfamily (MFS)4-hydroxybenzoate transporter [Paraburkholderia piptadeniae]|uniref:Major facilitator superfamily (MFS)4-hydroxybenzoate transporter n=1 Tax=Paraburkholderia piptadeniae TaxID=1701573 RepID=A0A1N7SIV8_9BURK|nr:MFS transporter [Paraburkholderia piptadeniae]SIT47349.1 Major facilitator superfamily (MFS)4-hydroxybenzoate transporter [Paraburkholderia piptadeniae]
MQRTFDVAAVIDSRSMSAFQWGIVATCTLAMAVDGFDAQAIGYVAPALIKDLGFSRAMLGPIFTAGVLGMGIGNLLLGLVSDKMGRKPVLVASLIAFGLLSLMKSKTSSPEMLIFLQFAAGAGIGGAYPNAIALTSEYVPANRRSSLVTLCAMGYLAGTTLGGFLAAALLPTFGWRSVFVVGGAIPLAVALVALMTVPESSRQLVAFGQSTERVRRILSRVAPDLGLPRGAEFIVGIEQNERGFPVRRLFGDGRAVYTSLIWTTVFMLLVATYFVFSWLPTLFAEAGMSIGSSVLASSAFPVGSALSSLALARLLRRRWATLALSGVCALYAVALTAMGWMTHDFLLLVAVVFLAGVGSGTQGVTHALNVAVYPALIRSTGVGWATGIGRLGSMLGSLMGGVLVAWKWGTVQILYVAAVPCVIAALAMILIYLLPATRRMLEAALHGDRASVPVAEKLTTRLTDAT